ncbi:MAG: UDP-N-acetylmuramoyl-L-alanyl-D-glutamate--2,6-diaminopimelate ligase [Bacteroidetes bacterium]|nr:UDP-N-acetylmuramoyl-L-alanyl-D-glutamate--2,6-diaminopimelate ligase [Bacteroidota bacterium]
MIKLKEILKNISISKIEGSQDILVKGITIDTRLITNDTNLFIATKGYYDDGHKHIDDAINKGCNIIICEKLPAKLNDQVTYVEIEELQKNLGIITSNFYNNPSSKIKLIGITGTNGKTTTATILYDIFKNLGYKVGLISTIHNIINNQIKKTNHTTPSIIEINKLLSEMIEAGCEYCFMEVSSHAIDQNRIYGLDFVAGIFLNISQDHLDYHKIFPNYIKTKKKFFDNLSKESFALYNADDPNGKVMIQNCNAKINSFSLQSPSDYNAKLLSNSLDFMEMKINDKVIYTKFPGNFNAYNFIAAYACSTLLDQDLESILIQLSDIEPPKGRFNFIPNNKEIYVIIDYAHTPDALQNVLSAISQAKDKDSSVITVIGCGGNRDKEKRPMMGRISSKLSTKTIFTSDNPRDENPNDIVNDMISGVSELDQNNIITIINRREAIKTALLLAQQKDIVLIAGKGHEDYQEIESIKHHFDDMEVAKEFL